MMRMGGNGIRLPYFDLCGEGGYMSSLLMDCVLCTGRSCGLSLARAMRFGYFNRLLPGLKTCSNASNFKLQY